jgi:hypothetical protein
VLCESFPRVAERPGPTREASRSPGARPAAASAREPPPMPACQGSQGRHCRAMLPTHACAKAAPGHDGSTAPTRSALGVCVCVRRAETAARRRFKFRASVRGVMEVHAQSDASRYPPAPVQSHSHGSGQAQCWRRRAAEPAERPSDGPGRCIGPGCGARAENRLLEGGTARARRRL